MTNTTFAQLDATFTAYKDSPQKPIVIYLHGGAIGRKKVEKQIEEHLSVSAFKESDCLPIYLLYHSGILEVIVNNVLETFQTRPGGEELDGGFDSLETILKGFLCPKNLPESLGFWQSVSSKKWGQMLLRSLLKKG